MHAQLVLRNFLIASIVTAMPIHRNMTGQNGNSNSHHPLSFPSQMKALTKMMIPIMAQKIASSLSFAM